MEHSRQYIRINLLLYRPQKGEVKVKVTHSDISIEMLLTYANMG